jgi:hypothetical protein
MTNTTDALTAKGALLVADAAVYDHSDMYRIALKTLAHEYRVMRAKVDRLERTIERYAEAMEEDGNV